MAKTVDELPTRRSGEHLHGTAVAGTGSPLKQTPLFRAAARSVALPEDTDPVAVAAAMNPPCPRGSPYDDGSSSGKTRTCWFSIGATGNAGRMAVQVAKLLGADRIIAAGRDADRLARLTSLGATDTVLSGPCARHPPRPQARDHRARRLSGSGQINHDRTRCPVLVLTRAIVRPHLNQATVTAITSTIRGLSFNLK
jgi:threonine dehydrogenase-like Zn-dependent dehydrogenase